MLVVAFGWLGLGCEPSPSSGRMTVETTPPLGGEGPANEQPLLPMRAGLHLSTLRGAGVRQRWEVVRVSDDGVAVTSDGLFARSEHGWGRLDPLIYRPGFVASREFSEVLDGVVLDVPDTVRVGMTWRSGPFEFEVSGREEGVETRLGPRTVWTITRSGVAERYIEGVGPWLDGIVSAVVPLEESAPLPAIAPVPLGREALLDLEESVDAIHVYARDDGLTLTVLNESVTCLAVRVRDGAWEATPLRHQVHDSMPDDPQQLSNTCHVLAFGPSFEFWAPPEELWMSPSRDLFRGLRGLTDLYLFGVADDPNPHVLRRGAEGHWQSHPFYAPGELSEYRDELSWTASRFAPRNADADDGLRLAGTASSDGTLRFLYLDAEGHAATATFDRTRGVVTRAAMAPPAPGPVTIRVHPGGHDRLAATAEGAILARGDDGRFSRIATVDVPPAHTLVGAARMGELDPNGLLVVTRSVSVREPGSLSPDRVRAHLFRVELGVEMPEPTAPASAVIATSAGHDALVCWPPTEATLDTTGWVFAGRPAPAVIPVPDEPGCALVFRDLAALGVTEGLVVEGPIPGVGRALVTVDDAPHDAVLGASTPSAILADEVVTDALGLPLRARTLRGDAEVDATGAGVWMPVLRDTQFGAALERVDGSVVEVLQPTPEMPVAASVSLGRTLATGGIHVSYRDGSVVAQTAVRSDETIVPVLLPPSYLPFGGGVFCMLGSGRVCMLFADGLHCALSDGSETIIAASLPTGEMASACQDIADGILLVYSSVSSGYVIVDVNAEVTLASGMERLAAPRWLTGALASPLLDGSWARVTPSGLERIELPGLPASTVIHDLAATDDVWIVSTSEGLLRLPRR